MNKYLAAEDAVIERKSGTFGGEVAVLQDEEGNTKFEFPAEMTDEQIMVALRFANHAYAAGVEHGKFLKVYEIKSVLGIA